jgi:tRNA(Arg) A34 adenosine deaminase TadA
VLVNNKFGITVSAQDARRRHPLQHAVMEAIAQVARDEVCRRANRVAARALIEDGTSRKRKSEGNEFSDGGMGECRSSKEVDQDAIYLCTGFDLFVSREPCVM